jgi:hypothetical protein
MGCIYTIIYMYMYISTYNYGYIINPDFGSSIVGGDDRLENRHLYFHTDRTTDINQDLFMNTIESYIPLKMDMHWNPRVLDEDSPTIIDQDNDTTDDFRAGNSTAEGICSYTYVYTDMYVYVYIYKYIYIYIYIYI